MREGKETGGARGGDSAEISWESFREKVTACSFLLHFPSRSLLQEHLTSERRENPPWNGVQLTPNPLSGGGSGPSMRRRTGRPFDLGVYLIPL